MNRSCTLMLVLACTSCLPQSLGDECLSYLDCTETQECVYVAGQQDVFGEDLRVCLPTPETKREAEVCTNTTDCITSGATAWPSDVSCVDSFCRCSQVFACKDEEVYEEESCSCVPLGGEGDACVTSFTCDVGLACDKATKQCIPGEGAGTACSSNGDCGPGEVTCEFRNRLDVGVCQSG